MSHLQAIRWAVRVVATLILPIVGSAAVFLALSALHAVGERAALVSTCLAAVGFSRLGVIESEIYFRELRSVVPRPFASAAKFLSGLAFVFLLSGAASIAAVAAASLLGLGGYRALPFAAVAAPVYVTLTWMVLTPGQDFVRGRRYRSVREILWLTSLDRLFSPGETIFFGGIRLPWASAVKHWLILGVTGSGKSMIFQLLMQDTLRGRIGRGRDERGIVYDNKTEIVPVLAALGVPYKIVNPFDRRGVAVDLPSLVPTHTASLEVASILMQRAKDVGSDPFWAEAPRNLLASVMTSLRLGIVDGSGRRRAISWDFRDLVLVMQSQEVIREVISRHPQTAGDVEGYFDDPRLLANVMATIKTSMMYYRTIAACWYRAPERLDLSDAVGGDAGYILVLGNDEQFRKAIDPMVRAVITRYGQLALKRPRSDMRRIWFFLDEFSDLKKLEPDLITGLLTKGRSRGISVLLGIQSLSSVVGEYGKEVAKVILSQCQNIALLGLGDMDDVTAEYATRVIGQIERLERREGESPNGLSRRRVKNEELRSRSVVLSSEFSDLPETVRGNGLPGYYRTRSIRGFWGAVLTGEFLLEELAKPDASVPALDERDERDHDLVPWDEADRSRLGLGRGPAVSSSPTGGGARPFRVYRGGKARAKKAAT